MSNVRVDNKNNDGVDIAYQIKERRSLQSPHGTVFDSFISIINITMEMTL